MKFKERPRKMAGEDKGVKLEPSQDESCSSSSDSERPLTSAEIGKGPSAFTKYQEYIKEFKQSTILTNLNRGNTQHTTPVVQGVSIHQLAAQGELALLKKELQTGAWDINSKDSNGSTPFIWACTHGQVMIVKYLLEKQAQVDVCNQQFQNALLMSSCYGHTEIVQLLLKQWNVDVDHQDLAGNSALMYAAFNNHAQCAAVLLNRGADLTLKNNSSLTALSIAIGRSHKAVQNVIEKHMLQLLQSS